MYWNDDKKIEILEDIEININMRCIEIDDCISVKNGVVWLTLTWDVLKYEDEAHSEAAHID